MQARTHACMYAHAHMYTCTHAHTHTYAHTHTGTQACTHAYTHTHTHARTHTHAHTHTYTQSTHLPSSLNANLVPPTIIHLHRTAHHDCRNTVSALRHTYTQVPPNHLHSNVISTDPLLKLCIIKEKARGVTSSKLETQIPPSSDVKRVKRTIATLSLGTIETCSQQLTSFSIKVSMA